MTPSTLPKIVASTIVSWFAWIGIGIGALSAISAIVHIFDLGLSSFFSDIIATYRKIASPLYDLAAFVGLNVPAALVDISILYVVMLAMSVRAAFLPLLDAEFFDVELRKTAKYETVISKEPLDPDNHPPNLVMAQQTDEGWKCTLQVNQPRSRIWAKWIILTITLWPVLTLLPVRKIRHPNLIFVKVDSTAWGTTIVQQSKRITYSNLFIHYEKKNFVRLIQMITLPIAVILFLTLATFNPL